MTNPIWRDLPNHPGYAVSDLGDVKSVRFNRLMSGSFHSKGYRKVTLSFSGRQVTATVHRLVAEAFLGPLPPGLVTRHLNGNPSDNRLANLAYGTHAENAQDAIEHGRNWRLGKIRCPNGHELNEENTSFNEGHRRCRTCRREQLRLSGVRRTARRVKVGHRNGEAHPLAKVADATVREAKRLYATGDYSQRQLARDFGVPRSTLRHWLLGESRSKDAVTP